MEPTLNVFAVINTLGALQCILTALALFSIKTGNRAANRFLGFFLVALAVIILDWVMYDTDFFFVVPQLYAILDPFVLLLGPLFLLYIKALTNLQFEFRRRQMWHFFLFTILFLLILPTCFESAEIKLHMIRAELNDVETPLIDHVLNTIVNIHIFAYFIASFRLVDRALKSHLPASKSGIPVNMTWLRNLILAVLCISFLSAIFDYIPMQGENNYNHYITPFLLTLIVYSMGYVGIRQSELFTAEKLFPRGGKYKKSALTDDLAQELLSKLHQLMVKEKLYRDSLLSLPKLAERLKITTHLLSQVLNERLDRNFFNFISEHRVEEAKEKLLEPESEKFTMLEMAYEVGFNSLSAFNTAFKKHTGVSPSEFKKQNTQR